jgi:uncharacterized protein YkwD
MKLFAIIILLFATPLMGQQNNHLAQRNKIRSTFKVELIKKGKDSIVADINAYRKDPVAEGKKINLNLKEFKGLNLSMLKLDSNLSTKAEKKAIYLANKRELTHIGENGRMPSYTECIGVDTDIADMEFLADSFITDDGNPDFGHRKALLSEFHHKIGVGIAKNGYGEIYYVLAFE